MPRCPRALPALALCLGLAACSQDSTSADMAADAMIVADNDLAAPPDLAQITPVGGDMAQTRPMLGPPIDVPKGSWQWVDFPDAVCDDGKPTGLGIRRTDSKSVLVYMEGGGACWDNLTCLVLNTATHGPFGKAEFDRLKGGIAGTVLDDTAMANPVRDWNMVFIPYCTGDVHAGDNVAMYTRPYYHKGRANVVAFLTRLGATFPTPDKLVVGGSSAGGYGAAFNYDLFRQYFPGAGASYLLDDSGTIFIGDAIRPMLRDAFYSAWKLDKSIGALCPGCKSDLTAMIPIMAVKYPRDRMALLSYTQDGTIRNFLGLSGMVFQQDLYDMAKQRLDPTASFRYYFVTGTSHVLLLNPGSFTSQGVKLNDWLTQMLTDDPEWKSIKP